MITAEEIKRLRSILGLTQKDLAEKIGTSIKTIANYEAGGVIPPAKQRLLSGMLKEVSGLRSNHLEGAFIGSSFAGRDNFVDVRTGSADADAELKKENAILKIKVDFLEKQLEEKERLISILMRDR